MFAALRVRNYRLFATGQLGTNFGTWVQRIAQDWLVLELTGYDPVALGIAGTLQFLPTVLFSLWAGVLADRLDKRKILLVVQSGAAACALVLCVLDVTGVVTLWHVYVLCVLLGVFSAFDQPVRSAFVAEVVGREHLANAVALNSSSYNLARIVGPAVAGLLILWVGTGWVFLLSGLSMAAVLVGLLRINPTTVDHAETRDPARLGEGLRYVRARRDVLTLMVLVFFVSAFAINFYTALPIMAANVFHRQADGYGTLFTLLAVGTLAGSLLAARRSARHTPGPRLLIAAAAGFGVAEAVAGLMPNYLTCCLMLVVVGFGMMTFLPTASTIVQLAVEPHLRGRVMGLYTLVFLGSNPIGAPLTGWVATTLGDRTPLVLGGALAAATAVVCGAVLVRVSVAERDMAKPAARTPTPATPT
jgi:MFS family permease